ncbi:MAG: hypothetical protein QNJ68_03830 [Microcoleaceae cyanobacterium MO_207.B10]|nr:hypothetical protein [Microcoleaceae cyanobacterium MO_207.B10]
MTENNRLSDQAIIFIPGFSSKEQGYSINLLSEGFQNLEVLQIQELGKVQISGHTGRKFIMNDGNTSQNLDIYEAFWLDIFSEKKLSNNNLQHKLFHGFYMLLYWVFSPVWKSFFLLVLI